MKDAIVISHLPEGPTVHFKLSSVQRSKSIKVSHFNVTKRLKRLSETSSECLSVFVFLFFYIFLCRGIIIKPTNHNKIFLHEM